MTEQVIAVSPLVIAVIIDTLVGSLRLADRPDKTLFQYDRATRERVLDGLLHALAAPTIRIHVQDEA